MYQNFSVTVASASRGGSGSGDGTQNILGPVHRHEAHLHALLDERFAAHVMQQLEKRRPEPLDVDQHDGLGVAAELGPRELLHQLLQRADAAGERDEGIRPVEHQLLALVHVLDHDHLVGVAQHALLLRQEFRNDAGHVSAVRQDRASNLAHEAEAAAAVDEADAGFGDQTSEYACHLGVGGIDAGVGATVDADVADGADFGTAEFLGSLLHICLVLIGVPMAVPHEDALFLIMLSCLGPRRRKS